MNIWNIWTLPHWSIQSLEYQGLSSNILAQQQVKAFAKTRHALENITNCRIRQPTSRSIQISANVRKFAVHRTAHTHKARSSKDSTTVHRYWLGDTKYTSV